MITTYTVSNTTALPSLPRSSRNFRCLLSSSFGEKLIESFEGNARHEVESGSDMHAPEVPPTTVELAPTRLLKKRDDFQFVVNSSRWVKPLFTA